MQIVVLLILLLSTPAWAATPTISGTTGQLSSGQNITITGANMVSEDKTNWGSFFTTHPNASGFEGVSYLADGYNDNGTADVHPNYKAQYVTNQKLMGNQSIYFHTIGSNVGNLTSYVYGSHGLPNTGDIWVRFYAKWTKNINPTSHIKMWDTFGGAYQQYFQPGTSFNSMIATNHATYLSGTPTPVQNNDAIIYSVPGGIVDDRWYEFEIHLKNTAGQPYIFDTYMDGQQITWGTSVNAAAFNTIMIGLINHQQTNPSAYMNHWWDGYAVSSTRVYPASVIEISDNATYGAGVVVKQEPLYLSDNSSQIKINLSGLGGGPYYLWVTNNRQERSAAYSFNLQTRTISAPGNLRFLTIGSSASSGSYTVLFTESFDDNSFAARSWYDGNTGTVDATEHIPGSTASLKCNYLLGGTKCNPADGSYTLRKKFTASNSVYISYWVKHSSNWVGSGVSYHPHLFHLLTNLNSDYSGLAYTYLTAYIEETQGYPVLAVQDGQNIDEMQVGVNLIGVTENRSVGGCNGTQTGIGQYSVDCYLSGAVHWNGMVWRGTSPVFFDAVEKTNWHQVEAYFQLNTITGGIGNADGIVRYWYDGNLVIDHSNVIIRTGQRPTMQFNQIVISPYIGSGSPVNQTVWFDNLTVATARPTLARSIQLIQ